MNAANTSAARFKSQSPFVANFEDPVGVNLIESVTGELSGRGCVAGAPYGNAQDDAAFNLCGDIFGGVTYEAHLASPVGG